MKRSPVPPLCVDAAVTQERPMLAGRFNQRGVEFCGEDLFLIGHRRPARGCCPKKVRNTFAAPELQAWAPECSWSPGPSMESQPSPPAIAVFVSRDQIYRRYKHSIGNCVCTHHRLPRRILYLAVLYLLAGMQANCGGIEEESGSNAVQSGARPPGYHWSQQTSVPTFPLLVGKALKPRSPGVK